LFSALSTNIFALSKTINWGTHQGPSSPIDDTNASDPSSLNYLLQLNAAGSSTSNLDQTSSSNAYDGDLIELGFFDTNPAYTAGDDTSIDPNTDTSNMFTGQWTPLTSKTTIGQDWSSSVTVGTGLFFFKTLLTESNSGSIFEHTDGTANSNSGQDYEIDDDRIGTWASNANDTSARVKALNGETDAALIGIRFYDANSPSSGTVKYNTIMNAAWLWPSSNTENISLHAGDGTTASGLVFQYNNSDANSAGIAKVGTGDNTVTSNNFTATITYHDGSSDMNLSSASHIFSGLNGSGNITGGGDHIITLDVNNASNAYSFSGEIEGASNASVASTILKTGAGKQTLSGDVRLAGTSSGWLDINSGTLSLAPGNSKTMTFEYLTGAGGTLELNNTIVTGVEFGFANTSTSQEYDGNISLVGTGSENVITIGGSYASEQNVSGVISGSNELAKDGEGRLVLKGTNTNSGGVEIKNGTLVAGSAQALGNTSNTLTITKGKLEVDSGVTLNNGYTINTTNGEKSMIGGKGTLDKAVTIGSTVSANQIDAISPGSGISSSLSSESSKQQVSLGDRANAIGTFTVSDTLTLGSGGVYDWEITDFSGTASNTGAGTNWDLLKFDTLNFDSTSDVFTINIMSLDENGSAGAMSGGNIWTNYTSNGFLFMKATGAGNGWDGTGSMGSSGLVSNMDVNASAWSYYNSHHLNNWNVWYDGSGSFYLQYSVAPEPSTYVMVTGLMLVPGMNAVRKYRNRKKKQELEEPKEEIVS
jgi:autotransporter-associated beta strand protein